jgi:formylglycine-generating enzyme required for sulfatase activity
VPPRRADRSSTRAATALALIAASSVLLGLAPARRRHGCPAGAVLIDGRFCIDRFEASLVELTGRGHARPWSPFEVPARGARYRAVSRSGVFPQGYVSQVQARAACEAAGKRLCTSAEWLTACRGPSPTTFPYGDVRIPGRCNDDGINPVPRVFRGSRDVFHFTQMNDPRLNQQPRTLARTGQFRRCSNRYGVRDMVGNLHEWTDERHGNLGVFRGGYYADTHINGDGCNYATRAHGPGYHDYSTGFRCCADPR